MPDSDILRSVPEPVDEWGEKVSPVIMFPRLIAKSRSAFSKSRVIFKKPTGTKNAESFWKRRRRLFGAKNRQMSQFWNSITYVHVVLKKSHIHSINS
jgi:hypothetical protein